MLLLLIADALECWDLLNACIYDSFSLLLSWYYTF